MDVEHIKGPQATQDAPMMWSTCLVKTHDEVKWEAW